MALCTSMPASATKTVPDNNIGYAQPWTENNKVMTKEIRIDVSNYEGTEVYLVLSIAGSGSNYDAKLWLLEAWWSDEY